MKSPEKLRRKIRLASSCTRSAYSRRGLEEGAGVRGLLAFRSQGGSQWHLTDHHGYAWCGVPPGSLQMREGEPRLWIETADQDRCQTCRRIAPIPVIFQRLRRGKALSERVVARRAPDRARRTGGSWAWFDPGTTSRQYWGEVVPGTPRPRPPGSSPASAPPDEPTP